MSAASGPMACPVDGTTLVMSERSSIDIERSAQPAPSREPAQHTSPSRDFGNRGSYSSHGYSGRKRKKSFLEELFD